MDNESYTQESRSDDSPSDALSATLGLARITSAPDSLRPGTFSQSGTRPLYQPSRSSGPERSDRSSGDRLPPLDTLSERPEKRPRLDDELASVHGRTYKRGSSPEVSSAICRASYVWTRLTFTTEVIRFQCRTSSLTSTTSYFLHDPLTFLNMVTRLQAHVSSAGAVMTC